MVDLRHDVDVASLHTCGNYRGAVPVREERRIQDEEVGRFTRTSDTLNGLHSPKQSVPHCYRRPATLCDLRELCPRLKPHSAQRSIATLEVVDAPKEGDHRSHDLGFSLSLSTGTGAPFAADGRRGESRVN